MKHTIPKVTLLFFSALLLLPDLAAQDTASLTSTIRDKSVAVVPAAGIALKNTATGLTRNLVTNSDGEYLAAALPPGHYDLSVRAEGFRAYKAEGIILRVAQNARVDVTLQVG